jgi:hypothetical protein
MDALLFPFFGGSHKLDEAVRHNTEASQKVVEALASHGKKLKKLRVKTKKPLH